MTLGEATSCHTVSFTQGEQPATTEARWVVDAAGRASLLKRKLGLSRDVDAHDQFRLVSTRWRHRPRAVGR